MNEATTLRHCKILENPSLYFFKLTDRTMLSEYVQVITTAMLPIYQRNLEHDATLYKRQVLGRVNWLYATLAYPPTDLTHLNTTFWPACSTDKYLLARGSTVDRKTVNIGEYRCSPPLACSVTYELTNEVLYLWHIDIADQCNRWRYDNEAIRTTYSGTVKGEWKPMTNVMKPIIHKKLRIDSETNTIHYYETLQGDDTFKIVDESYPLLPLPYDTGPP